MRNYAFVYRKFFLYIVNKIYVKITAWGEISGRIGHKSDHVTHVVGAVYFLRNFSHKLWLCISDACCCGSLGRFCGIYLWYFVFFIYFVVFIFVVFMERRFFAILVVSFISVFFHFKKLIEQIVKQIIP